MKSQVAALVVALAWGGAARLHAIEPPEPDFGLVGIARGETARLSLVLCDGSVRPGDGSVRLCDGSVVPGVAAACSVSIGFVDATGDPIRDRSGRAVAVTRRLRLGVATSLDLSSSEVLAGGRLRRSFRPVVRVLQEPPEPDIEPPDPDAVNPCAGLVRTLEVFDTATGRTSFVYAPSPRFTEPPEPEHR
jgi:hypothetical protein